jgi:hypothetical protein
MGLSRMTQFEGNGNKRSKKKLIEKKSEDASGDNTAQALL